MKTKSLSIIGLILWDATAILSGMDANQLGKYTQAISSPDPSVRFAGIQEIADLLQRTPDKACDEIVVLLDKSLKDKDAKVRAVAAGSVAILAMETAPKFGPAKKGLPDLRNFPPLKGDLEKAIFDSDAQVRRAALGAYLFSFSASPDLQSRLLSQFSGEKNKGIQHLMVDVLITCESPTSATQDFLTGLLDDPNHALLVAQSIATMPVSSKIAPPPAALPKLADMLMKETGSSNRQLLARALGKYGAQARPYLGEIEKLRDREPDATTRLNLKAAADAIRTGRPQGGE